MLQPAAPPAIVSPAPPAAPALSPLCLPLRRRPAGAPAPGASEPPAATASPAAGSSPGASPSPHPAARGGPAIPAPRPWATAAWLAQHAAFSACARRGGLDAVFLGDSIAAFFPTRGASAWDETIAPLGAVADFGIEGDRTQFVLWRVLHGELDGSGARAVVLMVGTNNLASATPRAIADGIAAIVRALRSRVPNATVVLDALLPRGGPDDPARARAAAVNALIEPLADGEHVRWLDVGPAFVQQDGTIAPELMPDALHPSEEGYEIWAAALAPLLRDVLGK